MSVNGTVPTWMDGGFCTVGGAVAMAGWPRTYVAVGRRTEDGYWGGGGNYVVTSRQR